jgi:YidC/Oxa1 family membrane protein insertase
VDRNLLLAFALSFLVLVLWSSLQEPPPRQVPAPGGQAPGLAEPGLDEPGPAGSGDAPLAPAPEASEPVRQAAPSEPEPEESVLRFDRPLYRAELTSRGGALRYWELAEFDTGGDAPEPIVLTTGQPPHEAVAVTPFVELGFGDLGQAVWEVEAQDSGGASFVLERQGVRLRKHWRFEDSYTFRLRIDLENGSGADVTTSFAIGWPAHAAEGNDFREQALVALHEGSLEQQLLQGLGKGGFFGSLTGQAPQKVFEFPGGNDWAGAHTTYFLGAMLPDDPAQAHARFTTLTPGQEGISQIFFDPVRIPAGLALSREFSGYLGPKIPELLEKVGSSTIRSIDLGWSWVAPLTRFFGWTLHEIYALVPNYGVAIILLTILVRAVTTPLTLRQMRSMERMRAVQPRLKEIQEKHKDDRQKQSEEMMRLYRQEKVNPLGGCLPMILQLPVFIGLFYALRGSIQLRQAPFVGWIDDLSAPETLFVIPGLELPVRVLPLIMGATMVLQQRLTPMQMDPAQARMMMTVMPVVMTVVFYQFASGLVLYWMVSNVLAIAHQLWVGRRLRAGAAKT